MQDGYGNTKLVDADTDDDLSRQTIGDRKHQNNKFQVASISTDSARGKYTSDFEVLKVWIAALIEIVDRRVQIVSRIFFCLRMVNLET